MPGSNNFLQFNPPKANQETDSQYSSDATRSGGIVVNQIMPSPMMNKAWYQWSTFVTAFAAMMSVKGYNMLDTVLGNLQAVMANVLTVADVTASFITGVLGFTPIQSGGGVDQSSGDIIKIGKDTINFNHLRATVNGVDYGALAFLFDASFAQYGQASGGTITFPTTFGGTPGVSIIEFGGSCNLISVNASGATYNFSGGGLVSWIAVGPRP